MSQYQYYKSRLLKESFPFACIDLNKLDENINTNLHRAKGKYIRIASKSIRCREVINRILDSHDLYQGIMAYHPAEVLFLIEQGFDDILLGYPVVDSLYIERIAAHIKEGKIICFMVDSVDHLKILNATGKKLSCQIPICIDLDLSDNYPGLRFGVWRSSIQSQNQLIEFVEEMKKLDFIRLDGLMGYEAQIAGVGDSFKNNLIKNAIVKQLKKRSIPNVEKRRKQAVDYLTSEGFHLRFVNGGGTGSLESTTQESSVTEVTVGSGFYTSHLFDNYSNFELQPSIFYAIQIVRQPEPTIYTCHGGGFIASGGIEHTKAPQVYLPTNGQLDSLEGAGEVQTPIRFSELDEQLHIGDPIFMRHAKSGELLEHFNSIVLLDKDSTLTTTTYRGDGQAFG